MGDVVQFGAKRDETPKTRNYFACTECRCLTWYMFSDNEVRCAGCDNTAVNGEWRKGLPEATEDDPPVEGGKHHAKVDLNSSGAAKARHLRNARDNDCVLLARIERDGEVGVWSEGWTTPEQKAWFHARLERIKGVFDRMRHNG